ncbi:MAG TPA: hypothetical protein VIN77_16325 [Aurantimonas sp.]
MAQEPDFLANSVIVAAHPDDELLWFSSILKDVDQAIIVYCDFWAQPQLGAARRRAMADYPRGGVTSLAIAESGAIGCANWPAPRPSPYGVTLGLEASRREMTRLARLCLSSLGAATNVAEDSVAKMYQNNFGAIYDRLKDRLASDMNVFTHNPWGEYGHEEHIQVFRVLNKLRNEIGFKLWMSNYCTDRSLALAMHYFEAAPGPYVRRRTDKNFADAVAAVYRRHDCWTWADDWSWFDEECFMEAPRSEGPVRPHHHLFPINFFTIDAERPALTPSEPVYPHAAAGQDDEQGSASTLPGG